MSEPEKPLPVEQPLSYFLSSRGKPFRCECGCNLFHKPKERPEDRYECNACEAWYFYDGEENKA